MSIVRETKFILPGPSQEDTKVYVISHRNYDDMIRQLRQRVPFTRLSIDGAELNEITYARLQYDDLVTVIQIPSDQGAQGTPLVTAGQTITLMVPKLQTWAREAAHDELCVQAELHEANTQDRVGVKLADLLSRSDRLEVDHILCVDQAPRGRDFFRELLERHKAQGVIRSGRHFKALVEWCSRYTGDYKAFLPILVVPYEECDLLLFRLDGVVHLCVVARDAVEELYLSMVPLVAIVQQKLGDGKLHLAFDLDETLLYAHLTKEEYEQYEHDARYKGLCHKYYHRQGIWVYQVAVPGVGRFLKSLAKSFHFHIITRGSKKHCIEAITLLDRAAGAGQGSLFTSWKAEVQSNNPKSFYMIKDGDKVAQFSIGLDDDESRWDVRMRDQVLQMAPFHLKCWGRYDHACRGLGRAEDTDDLQGLCDWCMRERNGEHADWRKVTNSFKEGLIRIHNDFFGQIKEFNKEKRQQVLRWYPTTSHPGRPRFNDVSFYTLRHRRETSTAAVSPRSSPARSHHESSTPPPSPPASPVRQVRQRTK